MLIKNGKPTSLNKMILQNFLARGAGGLVLLLQGSETLPGIQTNETVLLFLAIILIMIGIIEIWAAVGVFLLRKGYIFIGIIITIIFVFDGAVNGYFLFGKPGDRGTIINVIAAVILITLLLAGQKSLKDNYKTSSNEVKS